MTGEVRRKILRGVSVEMRDEEEKERRDIM